MSHHISSYFSQTSGNLSSVIRQKYEVHYYYLTVNSYQKYQLKIYLCFQHLTVIIMSLSFMTISKCFYIFMCHMIKDIFALVCVFVTVVQRVICLGCGKSERLMIVCLDWFECVRIACGGK